ncbi:MULTISPECIES: cation:proton antiporter domain-containing protein [Streptomyces]|uniref:cation:proton antiporter domain-containing protein n=1 Tax=Streptomyces TaxID=1883 RepID=UPI0006AE24A9|nr:cation:proton antiporter [Streptomyces sp. XY413]
MLHWSADRGWSTPDWRQFLTFALPLIAYALCAVVEGSGFIGAWAAGLVFGSRLRDAPSERGALADGTDLARSTEFSERLGLLLASVSFLAFGAVILGPALQHVTRRMVVYALISLTVVRMLPVALAMAGTALRNVSVAYIGWFGPCGLASLVFGLFAFEEHLAGMTQLNGVIAVTVGLSVLLHGATAPFLGNRYGNWFTKTLRTQPGLRENTLTADSAPNTPGLRGPHGP